MSEILSQNFDLEYTYELCEKIILHRDFQCLIKLNEQCELLYNGRNFPNSFMKDLTMEEDALFILLYYIYYILLDFKERNIFYFLQKIIILRNLFVLNLYYNNDFYEEESFDLDEEKQCYQYVFYILEKYSGIKQTNKTINYDLDNINDFIYQMNLINYSQIPNNFYLVYMLGIGELNYKNIISQMSYDILLQKINETINIIFQKFKNDSFNCKDMEDCPYIDEAEELKI